MADDLALKPAGANSGVSPIISNASAFLDLLMGSKSSQTSGGGTTTTSGGTSTQQTQLSPDAINQMIRTMFEGTGGLADVALGAHTAGMYGDTTQVSLLQNLITKIGGAAAVAGAPTVTTTSPRTVTTTPTTATTAVKPKLTADSVLQSLLLAGSTAVGSKLLKKSGLLDALGLGDSDSPLSTASTAIRSALGFGGSGTPALTASNLVSGAAVPAGAVDSAEFAGLSFGGPAPGADAVGSVLTASPESLAATSVVDPITGAVSPADQINAASAVGNIASTLTTGVTPGAGALGITDTFSTPPDLVSPFATGVPDSAVTSAAGSGGVDTGAEILGYTDSGNPITSYGSAFAQGGADLGATLGETDAAGAALDFGVGDLLGGAGLFEGAGGLDFAAGAALDFGIGDLLPVAAAGSSVVCYELVRTGGMTPYYAKISSDYAEELPRAVLRGYHWMCPWLLHAMRKYPIVYNILKVCANARSKELETEHLGGRTVRWTFEPLCFILGITVARRTRLSFDVNKMLSTGEMN